MAVTEEDQEASARIAREEQKRADGEEGHRMELHVFVCPTEGCGNYYGSSTERDLGSTFTGPKVEDRAEHKRLHGSPYRHSRAECPDCRAQGVTVERTLVVATCFVPKEGPPTPALPVNHSGFAD